MEIKTYNKIDDLKSIWNEIYEKSKQCPTLEFDFVKNWNKTLKQKKALILKRGKIIRQTFVCRIIFEDISYG